MFIFTPYFSTGRKRFIYAINEPIISAIQPEFVINLADEKGLQIFSDYIKSGDSVTFVAQGNVTDETIAGFSANMFLELLTIDLELKGLNTIELFAGNMGYCEQFRETVSQSLESAEKLVTYRAIPTANSNGVGFFVDTTNQLAEESEDDSDALLFLSVTQIDDSIRMIDAASTPGLILS